MCQHSPAELYIDSNGIFYHTHHIALTLLRRLSHLSLHFTDATFNSPHDIQDKVDLFLDSRSSNFRAKSIQKLPKHWHKIIDFGLYYYPH